MEIFRFVFNLLEENTWVVCGPEGRSVVIDPGCLKEPEREQLRACLDAHRPEAVLLTHGHFDHVFGAAWVQQTWGIPVYMSPEDKKTLEYFGRISRFGLPVPDCSFSTTDIADGDTVRAAGLEFKVISTPGHSPGSVCLMLESERALFTGDTLFAGAIGRTDLIYGDYDEEIRSIMEKLVALPGDIAIYPGHGPASSISDERTGNPFLEPFNEREEIPELNEDFI